MTDNNTIARAGFLPIDGRKREHVPHIPAWQGILRIFQAILALTILVLTAYAVGAMESVLGYSIRDWDFYEITGYPFTWFAFIWTTAYFIYLGVTLFFAPVGYLYWVHLVLECLTLLWWLIGFALLTDISVRYTRLENTIGVINVKARDVSTTPFPIHTATKLGNSLPDYEGFLDYFQNRADNSQAGTNCTYAAAALAGLLWALFIVSLTCLCIAIHRHRAANRPAMGFNPSRANPPPTSRGPPMTSQIQPGTTYATPHVPGSQHQQPIQQSHTGSTSPSAVLGHSSHQRMTMDSGFYQSTSEQQMTIPIYPPNAHEMQFSPAGDSTPKVTSRS